MERLLLRVATRAYPYSHSCTCRPPCPRTPVPRAHARALQCSPAPTAAGLDWTEPPPPPPLKPKPKPAAPAPQYVVALYDFDAQADGDLDFKAGDRIEVVERTGSSEDWWTGRVGGRQGVFPGESAAPRGFFSGARRLSSPSCSLLFFFFGRRSWSVDACFLLVRGATGNYVQDA